MALNLNVELTGLKGETKKNALENLTILSEQHNKNSRISRIRRLHAKAPVQILSALEPYGYYNASVASDLRKIDNTWLASYQVTLGEPARISELDIKIIGSGESDPEFISILSRAPLIVGERFIHADYEKTKASLVRAATTRGYLDAGLKTHQVTVDKSLNNVSIALHLVTGTRYHYGNIIFTQEGTVFEQPFLDRFLVLENGQPYNSRDILRQQSKLNNSGYFEKVTVRAKINDVDGYFVPIDITLKARKKRRYRFGIGLGTDTGGVRASAEHSRRVNKQGHKAIFSTKLATKLRTVNSQYIIPLKDPSAEELTFSAGITEQQTDSRDTRSSELGVQRRVIRGRWQETVSLNYQRERSAIADVVQTTNLVFPGVSWTRIHTEDRVFSKNGWRLTFSSTGSSASLGSDASYLQVMASGKWIRQLAEKSRLITRLQGGTTPVGIISEMPASKRFYAGGDQSVRGYGFEELGPTDNLGQVIGGKHLLMGSIEFDRRLRGKWYGAVFYDAGNAFNHLSEGMSEGAGVGIRWLSPVGSIRLDLASALSQSGKPWRVHLTIGPDL